MASGATPLILLSPSMATAVKNEAVRAASGGNQGGASGWTPRWPAFVTRATPTTASPTANHVSHDGFSPASGQDRIATQTGKVFVRVSTADVSIRVNA